MFLATSRTIASPRTKPSVSAALRTFSLSKAIENVREKSRAAGDGIPQFAYFRSSNGSRLTLFRKRLRRPMLASHLLFSWLHIKGVGKQIHHFVSENGDTAR